MRAEYIPLFLDFNETTQDLTDEECGRLIRAILDYANGEEDYERHLQGAEKIAFRFMKGSIDRNSAISEARSKAGASKKKKDQDDSNDDQNESNEIKEKQTEANENKQEQNESNSITKTKNQNQDQKTKPKTKTEKDAAVGFDEFWSAYPRKVAKENALKAFKKIAPDAELLQKMLSAVAVAKQSDQWTKDGGQFIPHPATWLNQHRWEDEPMKPVVPFRKVDNPATQYKQRDYSQPTETLEQKFKRLAEQNGMTV